jgi:predicted dehydrogenase
MTAFLGDNPWQEFIVSNRYAGKRREVRLHCRDGVAVLADPDQGFVEIVRGDAASARPEIEKRAYPPETALSRELAAFLGHVAGGASPKSDAIEGLAVVQTIIELRRLAGLTESEGRNLKAESRIL